MKNFLLFVLLFWSAAAMAQKSSWYVGGTIGVESTRPKGGDALSTWQLSPEAGTFISDNIQVGLALNISGGTKDYAEKKSGFGAYGRYFFKKGSAFRPFVGLAIPYSKTTDPNFGDPTVYKRIGANVNGGFAYAISDRWAVVGSLAAISFISEKREANMTFPEEATTQYLKMGANTLGSPFNIGIYYTFLK